MTEIVKFYDGSYGIRKRNWFEQLFNFKGKYLVLKFKYWTNKNCEDDSFYKDCSSIDVIKVAEIFRNITIKSK